MVDGAKICRLREDPERVCELERDPERDLDPVPLLPALVLDVLPLAFLVRLVDRDFELFRVREEVVEPDRDELDFTAAIRLRGRPRLPAEALEVVVALRVFDVDREADALRAGDAVVDLENGVGDRVRVRVRARRFTGELARMRADCLIGTISKSLSSLYRVDNYNKHVESALACEFVSLTGEIKYILVFGDET